MPFLVPPGVRLALKTHELLCIKNMIEETLEETCESTAIRCAFVVLNNEADRLRVRTGCCSTRDARVDPSFCDFI